MKKSNQKTQHQKNSNSNTLTYPYMVKILTYLKYQENLKIWEAQSKHCEKHKKYIQNLLEIVNIVNKEFPNSDLIINGKFLNYSIMNDEKLFQAATLPSSSSNSSPSLPNPLDNIPKTEIGATVQCLREETAKHEKRKKLLSYKIKLLIQKENSSRSSVINELLHKLFNIDYNTATVQINKSIPEEKNDLIIRRNPKAHPRKTSPSKSYSSSNLNQISRRKSDFDRHIQEDKSNINAISLPYPRKSFDSSKNSNSNLLNNESKSSPSSDANNDQMNIVSLSKSSSSTHLLTNSSQNHLANKHANSDSVNENNAHQNDNDNDNDNDNNEKDLNIKLNGGILMASLDDESDTPFNESASSSFNSCHINFPDYEEVIKEISLQNGIDHITLPISISDSESSDAKNVIRIQNKFHCTSDDNLSDGESSNRSKKNDEDVEDESDFEYSESETNDTDENLTKFQNSDENDVAFEETIEYIEDRKGMYLDFELLVQKASECTEFSADIISGSLRKIKKSPKDSGIHLLKLSQLFVDTFLNLEKKMEQQRNQQLKMEQDAIIAVQKNKIIMSNYGGFVPYTIPAMNVSNGSSGTKPAEGNKPKNVMRFLFVMFSKYIFNEIYASIFHHEMYYSDDFLFANSILNAREMVPMSSDELEPVIPFLPSDLHELPLKEFTNHESFKVYAKCLEDATMLQFESSLVDFCYGAFKFLDRVQKVASEILYNKKLSEEMEKIAPSSYHSTSSNNDKNNELIEVANSSSLPKASISSFNYADNSQDEDSFGQKKNIFASPSNSGVILKKSKLQLKADCQLSCDQLCDVTTMVVLASAPFELRRMIDLFSPFLAGLRLPSQLEFAFVTMQSVCGHILEFYTRKADIKKDVEEQKEVEEKNEDDEKKVVEEQKVVEEKNEDEEQIKVEEKNEGEKINEAEDQE